MCEEVNPSKGRTLYAELIEDCSGGMHLATALENDAKEIGLRVLGVLAGAAAAHRKSLLYAMRCPASEQKVRRYTRRLCSKLNSLGAHAFILEF